MGYPNGSDEIRGNSAAPEAPDQGRAAMGEPDRDPLHRARWFAAMGGLLAGLVAFVLGEAAYNCIPARQVTFNTMGTMVTAATAATTAEAEVKNATLTFGLLGLCLGGCLGVAGGAARRSVSAMAAAGLLGAILGAALTAGATFAVLPSLTKTRMAHIESELIVSMITHGLIWGLAGSAAGLAFAVGLGEGRRPGRALVGGLLGAVLGAIAYDLIGAVLFPLAGTGEPISTTWSTRLIARLLVGVTTAAGVILSMPRSHPARDDRPTHAVARGADPSEG